MDREVEGIVDTLELIVISQELGQVDIKVTYSKPNEMNIACLVTRVQSFVRT